MDGRIEPDVDEKTANQSRRADGAPDAPDAPVAADATLDAKKQAILTACEQRDLAALRELAESPGGFLTDSIRQQAWPILLGLSPDHIKDEAESDGATSSWESLPRHKDEDQVQLDVNRAFIYYPDNQTEAQLTHQKVLLSQLILSALRRHPYLHYFQGYHDIAQVLLLVLPPHLHHPSLTSLSLFHIRDFMLPSLQPAIAQLHLLPDILRAVDPPLWRHLSRTQPFFALAGTLTMYAHDITTQRAVARLFDALLARPPAFSVYLFAAIVRARRDELFETPPDEPEMLHSILSKLPVPLDLEALIAEAGRLEREVPPRRLPAWRRGISRWSVLKTWEVERRAEVGRRLFERQVEELRWEERKERARKWVWRHRRPAGTVGLAVLVGVLAILLRRGSLPAPVVSGIGYVSGLLARWW